MPRDDARHVADRLHLELVTLAQADHYDALGLQLALRVQHADLALLAADLAVLDEPGDSAIQRLVQRGGASTGLCDAFEYGTVYLACHRTP